MAELIASRAESLFNFKPPIERIEPKPGETGELFEYKIDKIKSLGFKFLLNIEDEIDQTLLYCKKEFESA